MSKAIAPRRTRVESGVYVRPDGAYEIGWRDAQGKQRWRKVNGRLKAARAALAEEHTRRGRGQHLAADPRLTFDRAADAWWDARVVKLSDNTQSTYRQALRHVRPEFGRRRMTDISATDVARYVSRKQASNLMGWTIKSHLKVLSGVYAYAARHLGLVASNPVALLDSVERPCSSDEKPKRILNADELAALVRECAPSTRLVFEVAAQTGARISEVLGLAWEDIDFDGQAVAFMFQLAKARRGKPARRVPLKTRRSRRVLEVTPALIHALRVHKISMPRCRPHDLVFIDRDGVALSYGHVSYVLEAAARAAGLEAIHDECGTLVAPAPTCHALRHTHASALIAQGWDIAEVSARLGHASVAVTQRTYVHQFDAASRSAERRARLAQLYTSDRLEETDDDVAQKTVGS